MTKILIDIIAILTLANDYYHAESPQDIIRNIGHATNEYYCNNDYEVYHQECAAHCAYASYMGTIDKDSVCIDFDNDYLQETIK